MYIIVFYELVNIVETCIIFIHNRCRHAASAEQLDSFLITQIVD